jgi:branched-chain amino acid transport system substrate-binding protein
LKKRGASTSTLIGSLIVGLLIGAGIIYAAAPTLGLGSATTKTVQVGTATTTVNGGTATTTVVSTVSAAGSGLCNGQTLTIGALNDLSGDLSAQGKGDLLAENHAITDINAYLQSSGCNLKFALNSQDYQLKNALALSQFQAMIAAGVQVVIGPLNSGTAQFILPTADSNHVVLISPSSTSAALAFPPTASTPKYLFRTAPADTAQGLADARIMVDRGVQGAIIINRDDTYGNGLANSTRIDLIADGVSAANIKGPYKYDTTTTDFSSLISQIASDYTTLSSAVGAAHVAIYAVSFQELGTLLIQAHNSNPSLLTTTLPWFGTDGEAQNQILVNATGSGSEMAQVRLPSTLFNVINNTKTAAFIASLTPSERAIAASNFFYTLEGYDDTWLAALATLSAGKYDGTAIHGVMASVANGFYGLTGWEGLQDTQDRIPGSYQVWKVVQSGSAYDWVLAGTWSYDTDRVTWINPP